MTKRDLKPLVRAAVPYSRNDQLATGTIAEGGEVLAIASGWRLAVREFAENRVALVGLGIIVFFILLCFVGPLFYHTNQSLTQPLQANLAPGAATAAGGTAGLLGTDEHGFDELGRIMVGGQAALEVGFFAAVVATVIGTLYGAIAGLAGRVVDGIMMRFVDIVLSIPFLFIVLVLGDEVLQRRSCPSACYSASSPGSSRHAWSAARCSRCASGTSSLPRA